MSSYRCKFVEAATAAYFCPRCDPDGQRPVPEPGKRVCRAPIKPLAPEMEDLVRAHRPDCKGRKVSRQVFRERAEKCDGCELRKGLRCCHPDLDGDGVLEPGLGLLCILPWACYGCPAAKWPAQSASTVVV